MAAPTPLRKPVTAGAGGMMRACMVSQMALVAQMRADHVLLDADATVTDTNFASLWDAVTGVAVVTDINGTTITA